MPSHSKFTNSDMDRVLACPSSKPKPRYSECGCCGHFHRVEYRGDCRNDLERFTDDDLERKHPNGWTGVFEDESESDA